jgi:hypothetical protein
MVMSATGRDARSRHPRKCAGVIWAARAERRNTTIAGYRPPDAAPTPSNNGSLIIEPKLGWDWGQSETPRFHGMKSSWLFSSALVRSSPLAI